MMWVKQGRTAELESSTGWALVWYNLTYLNPAERPQQQQQQRQSQCQPGACNRSVIQLLPTLEIVGFRISVTLRTLNRMRKHTQNQASNFCVGLTVDS